MTGHYSPALVFLRELAYILDNNPIFWRITYSVIQVKLKEPFCE